MRSGGQDFSRHPDVLEVTDEAARRPTSKPFSVSPCAPHARPAPRSAVGHHAHGAGRRGRRPLPPSLPRRGPAREGPAPPPARGVRTGPAREGLAPPRRRAFVADEVADEAARKPASKPFSVSPCLPALRVNRPEARSPVRSRRSAPLPVAVGHPAHGAGRRGRRPLPPILPRCGPAREVPAPPSAPGCQVVETSRSGPSVNEVPGW